MALKRIRPTQALVVGGLCAFVALAAVTYMQGLRLRDPASGNFPPAKLTPSVIEKRILWFTEERDAIEDIRAFTEGAVACLYGVDPREVFDALQARIDALEDITQGVTQVITSSPPEPAMKSTEAEPGTMMATLWHEMEDIKMRLAYVEGSIGAGLVLKSYRVVPCPGCKIGLHIYPGTTKFICAICGHELRFDDDGNRNP